MSPFTSLAGEGGLFSDGRWHTIGRRIVYLAESSALALLEAIVRLDRSELPEPYQLLRIEGATSLPHLSWPASEPPGSEQISKAWGDTWLERAETALAKVPARVAPHSFNYLLNPAHPDAARVHVAAAGRYPWDHRLFR